MTKRMLWYVCLGLLCCGAVAFMVNAAAIDVDKANYQKSYHQASASPTNLPPRASSVPSDMVTTKSMTTPAEMPVPVTGLAADEAALMAEKEAYYKALGQPLSEVLQGDAAMTTNSAATMAAEMQAEKDAYSRPQRLDRSGGRDLDEGGEDCATATNIAGLPYSDIGFTCDNLNDYDAICPFTGSTSSDVVYSYTPAANEDVTFTLCGNSDYDTKLYIYAGACVNGTHIACNDDACTTPSYPNAFVSRLLCVPLTAGTTYYIVVDGYGGDCGNYTFDASVCEACDVVCQGGDVIEAAENPADPNFFSADPNGGCNNTANNANCDPDGVELYGALNCGETVCGVAFTYAGPACAGGGSYRDTDAYTFTIAQACTVRWSVVAEFPVALFILNSGCPWVTVYASGSETLPCTPLTIQAVCLDAGTYTAWVGPSVFDGIPTPLQYRATLTCSAPCPVGRCCYGNQCDNLTEQGCALLGGVWTGGITCESDPCPACAVDLTLNAPGSTPTVTTCGAVNNCNLRPSEDILVQVNIPTDGQWFFSTCHPTVNWDAYMYLTTECCGGTTLAQDDDACPEFGVGLPRIPFSGCMTLTAGTYYVALEGFSSLGCGDIALTVGECAPCIVECQPGDVPECAEPATPDSTNMSTDCNGGCNNTSGIFTNQPINCGETVCGRLFTYLRPSGTNVRDTDAYDFTITETCTVRWSARAECPIDLYILNSGCPWATVYAFASQPSPCSLGVALAVCLPAGSYTAWVGPSVFSGIPTPVEYRATLECIPCPPPGEGDDCANSYPIPGLPFNVSDNSCNYQDNSDEICPFTGSTSADVAYTYVPAADVQVNVDLCNSEYDTKVYVYENGVLIACNDDFCDDPLGNPFRSYLNCVQLLAGNTYCFVVDGFGGDCGVYNLSISECTPCIISCQPGDVDEVVEDFDDPNFYVTDPDGGCNNDVPAFQEIECGSTICGITRTYTSPLGDTRDTDWFRFTTVTQTNVTWRVQSETAVTIFLIDVADCNNITILAQGNVTIPCVDEGVATADLAPGTYAAWVGPSVFAGVPPSAFRGTLEAVCACEVPENLTVLRGVGPANSVNLRWVATQNIGRYEVYRTTNPNNDGDPDNGADPQWGVPIAVIPAPAAPPATLTYDDAPLQTYANYVVVHNCAPIARCCYNGGADCANNTQAECDALAGVWDFGLSCENDPCPVILLGDDACGAANPLLTNGQMIVGNNVGATTDAVWGCAAGGSDVWYRYVATATGTVDVNLCGSLYDTAVQIQDACGGVVIVCQDDSPDCGLQSHTSFAATGGVTYWIAVGGFASGQGTYNLLVSQ